MAVSMKQMAKLVRKIRLSNNMILVLKSDSEAFGRDDVQALSDMIIKMGFHNVLIVLTDDVSDIQALDDKQMNAAGWFKVDTLRRLIKQKQEARNEESQETSGMVGVSEREGS